MLDQQSRRRFLCCAAAMAVPTISTPALVAADDPGAVRLLPRGGDLFRVRVELEVEGNVDVPRNPLVSRQSEVKLPVKSEAVLDCEERYYRSPEAPAGSAPNVVQRYYHEAHNESRLNHTEHRCELRDSVRETVIRRDTLPELIYATDDYFQREELDLLRVPVCSAAVDLLLPADPVSQGSRYAVPSDALVSVLNLSSIEQCDVQGEVILLDQSQARIQFRGDVDGSVEGVPTVIRIIGKLTFDRAAGTSTWVAMALHETRDIGTAEPGFDVAATIKMIRKPLTTSVALPHSLPFQHLGGPVPGNRLFVDIRSAELGISVLMDRTWRMMRDVPGAAMMRKIDQDRSIAQCDFRPLATLQPGQQWTLQAFQADVQKTLGEQLTELIEADERVSATGLRVLRVVAVGAVEEVPIQWIMLHFSDDSGRRVLASFTMEGRNVEAFAGSDVQTADSLRFVEQQPTQRTLQKQEITQKPSSNRAVPKVARSNSGEIGGNEVQSASDLR